MTYWQITLHWKINGVLHFTNFIIAVFTRPPLFGRILINVTNAVHSSFVNEISIFLNVGNCVAYLTFAIVYGVANNVRQIIIEGFWFTQFETGAAFDGGNTPSL